MEQTVYARLLQWGAHLGLIILVGTFLVYVFKLLPLRISPENLASVWGLPVSHYLEAMAMGRGWEWISHVGNGDILPLIGVTFLASVTVLCYLPLLFVFVRKRDILYSLICLAEIVVLTLAASGLVRVGH